MLRDVLELMVPLGAVIGLIYVLFRTHWIFAIVMCMFPLEQLLQTYVPALARNHTLVNIGIGSLVLVGILIRGARQERIGQGANNAMLWALLGLYALWTAGLAYTPNPEFQAILISSAPYIIVFIGFLPLLFVDLEDLNRILVAFLILGSLIAALIIAHPNATFYSGRLTLEMGLSGILEERTNPLVLATMGAQMAFVALYLRPRVGTRSLAILRVTAFVLGLGLAIFSGSRGQVIGAGLIGLICFPLARRLDNPRQFMLNAIAFVVLFGISMLTVRFFITDVNRDRWDVLQMLDDIGGRFAMSSDLMAVWISDPSAWLLGLGPGAFAVVSQYDAPYVHNVVVEVLCEHGLIGFALFCGMCVIVVRHAKLLWSTIGEDPVRRSTVAVMLALALFATMQSMKQGSISFPQPFFWWLILTKLAIAEKIIADRAVREAAWYDESPSEEEWETDEYDHAALEY